MVSSSSAKPAKHLSGRLCHGDVEVLLDTVVATQHESQTGYEKRVGEDSADKRGLKHSDSAANRSKRTDVMS